MALDNKIKEKIATEVIKTLVSRFESNNSKKGIYRFDRYNELKALL